MSDGHTLYLSTGSNIGSRKDNLTRAYQLVSERIGKVVRQSSIYETEAWGDTEQENYFNQALEVQTTLEPMLMLKYLQEIEIRIGRVKHKKWEPRVIDVDILFYESEVIEEELNQ